MGPNKNSKKATTKQATQAALDVATTVCSICEENSDESLQCKVCKCHFHPSCVDMSDDVFNKLLPILPTVGWVCEECVGLLTVKRNTLKKEIAGLQTTVSRMETEFLVLVNRVNELSTKVEMREKPLSQPVINATPARQTYDDKRRFNVMVSGLVESTDKQDDKQTIKELLHTTLELQPTIVSCRRVGKTVPDRPRKLLVSFAHASARDDVLALAKEKKLSLLPASKGIFINPDLSPAEAKAAYEARQARRIGTPANPTSEVVSPLPVNQ